MHNSQFTMYNVGLNIKNKSRCKFKNILMTFIIFTILCLALLVISVLTTPRKTIANERFVASENNDRPLAPTETGSPEYVYYRGMRIPYTQQLKVFYIHLPFTDRIGPAFNTITWNNFRSTHGVLRPSGFTHYFHYVNLIIIFNNMLYNGNPFFYSVNAYVGFSAAHALTARQESFIFPDYVRIGLTQNHYTWLTQGIQQDFSSVSISISANRAWAPIRFFNSTFGVRHGWEDSIAFGTGARIGFDFEKAAALYMNSPYWNIDFGGAPPQLPSNTNPIPDPVDLTLWDRVMAWFRSTFGIDSVIVVAVFLVGVAVVVVMLVKGVLSSNSGGL